MSHQQPEELRGTAVAGEKSKEWCFRYENAFFHSTESQVTILQIKVIVGQEPEVPLAEVIDGRQVERPNDYVVDLPKGCAFKRVPEFVRG
jgi:hypothetical protein